MHSKTKKSLNKNNIDKTLIIGILAGGDSRRFGKNKAFIKYNNTTLIELAVKNALKITNNVYIVAKNIKLYENLNCSLLKDTHSKKTPLSGILTILPLAKEWLFLTACDVPFLKPELFNLLWSQKECGKITIFQYQNMLHPFLALYPKNTYKHFKKAYNNGEKKLQWIIKKMPNIIIKQEEIIHADPLFSSFININDEKDLRLLE